MHPLVGVLCQLRWFCATTPILTVAELTVIRSIKRRRHQFNTQKLDVAESVDDCIGRITDRKGVDYCSSFDQSSLINNKLDLSGSSDKEKRQKKVCANSFRAIIYTEGELDHSNKSLPPSRKNPHPFTPSANPLLLPPTHSWSLAPFVNHLPILQILVELGMNLFEADTKFKVGQRLVRLNWRRDVRPKLHWLIADVGLPVTEIGSYLSRNPFFLFQDLEDMKVRVNYLWSKHFNRASILKVVVGYRFWLNTDVKTIDRRLGWFQKTFDMSGNEVRKLIIKEPRILISGVGPIERLISFFVKELEFTIGQTKSMLFNDPRMFMIDVEMLRLSYNYLRFLMGITNSQIVHWPMCLRHSVAMIRRRHEFLVKIQKAVYEEGGLNSIALCDLLQPSDRLFAVKVAHTYLAVYNDFLKNY